MKRIIGGMLAVVCGITMADAAPRAGSVGRVGMANNRAVTSQRAVATSNTASPRVVNPATGNTLTEGLLPDGTTVLYTDPVTRDQFVMNDAGQLVLFIDEDAAEIPSLSTTVGVARRACQSISAGEYRAEFNELTYDCMVPAVAMNWGGTISKGGDEVVAYVPMGSTFTCNADAFSGVNALRRSSQWVVPLMVVGGAGAGYGIGYAVDNAAEKKQQERDDKLRANLTAAMTSEAGQAAFMSSSDMRQFLQSNSSTSSSSELNTVQTIIAGGNIDPQKLRDALNRDLVDLNRKLSAIDTSAKTINRGTPRDKRCDVYATFLALVNTANKNCGDPKITNDNIYERKVQCVECCTDDIKNLTKSVQKDVDRVLYVNARKSGTLIDNFDLAYNTDGGISINVGPKNGNSTTFAQVRAAYNQLNCKSTMDTVTINLSEAQKIQEQINMLERVLKTLENEGIYVKGSDNTTQSGSTSFDQQLSSLSESASGTSQTLSEIMEKMLSDAFDSLNYQTDEEGNFITTSGEVQYDEDGEEIAGSEEQKVAIKKSFFGRKGTKGAAIGAGVGAAAGVTYWALEGASVHCNVAGMADIKLKKTYSIPTFREYIINNGWINQ